VCEGSAVLWANPLRWRGCESEGGGQSHEENVG
jgi:hypothetical protein